MKEILKDIQNSAYFSCDEPDVREAFTNKTSSEMNAFIRGAKTIVLDEAQRINGVGISLKLLHDTFPDLTIIATGSSSFDLANQVGEPLTGRKTTLTLYPISQLELLQQQGNRFDLKQQLEQFLIYGSYFTMFNFYLFTGFRTRVYFMSLSLGQRLRTMNSFCRMKINIYCSSGI